MRILKPSFSKSKHITTKMLLLCRADREIAEELMMRYCAEGKARLRDEIKFDRFCLSLKSLGIEYRKRERSKTRDSRGDEKRCSQCGDSS